MLDFSKAIVKQYEVGLNVECNDNPDLIMEQIDRIVVKKREYRVLEDRSQTEYKQYGTNRKKRGVYNFYNKTFEADSKHKNKEKQYYVVPDNILRIEKDNRIPVKKIMFLDLFKKEFQELTKNEFRQRFIADIFFKEIVSKRVSKDLECLSKPENRLLTDILENGEDKVLSMLQLKYKHGDISRASFFRRKQEIKKIMAHLPEYVRLLEESVTMFYEGYYKDIVIDKLEKL
jgi:hypothetical protein